MQTLGKFHVKAPRAPPTLHVRVRGVSIRWDEYCATVRRLLVALIIKQIQPIRYLLIATKRLER